MHEMLFEYRKFEADNSTKSITLGGEDASLPPQSDFIIAKYANW